MRRLIDGPELDDPLAPYRAVNRSTVGERPWVLANMVASLDGSAAVQGRAGGLSHPADRNLFLLLRGLADVILVGAATVRQERYGPAHLPEDVQRTRAAEGRRPVPDIAVVTRSLDLDLDGRLFAESPADRRPLVVTCTRSDDRRRAEVGEVADVIVAGDEAVDVGAALATLRRRGAAVVLSEGGPALLGQLVHGGFLDELCLTLAPVMGGDPLPISTPAPTTGLVGFRLGHVLTTDSNLFLRYEREVADA